MNRPRGRRGATRSPMNTRGKSMGRPNFERFGPPDKITEMGLFLHACEGDMVCKSVNTKIPYFNAPIYLENKNQIGRVDEILGPMNEVYFTVKLDEGIVATSFKLNDRVYIGEDKLLPLERFLPKPPAPKKVTKKRSPVGLRGRGGNQRGRRGASRGVGHGFRGGRGGRGGGGGGGGRGGFGGFGRRR